MSKKSEEKLAEKLEILPLEFEADNNGIITAFSDIGLAGGSDGAPSAGGSKDILTTPGYGNTLNQISQLDFKFVKASSPSDLAEPQDGEIKVTLYPYGERKGGDGYDSPVLVIGGTWNGVRYAPHVDYISGSSSQVAPIWIHPRSGKIEATVFSAPSGGFNNLTLTANADGFLISGGTSNSRSLTITGGNITLTSGSNNPNVTIPNTATATAVVNTSSFTQYGVVFSSSATNGIVTSTGQGASGQPLVGAGASNPVFGNINIGSYVTGTLGVGFGGTGTATTFTQGSIVFAGGSGIYTQDNANLFWDDSNDTLGVGTTRSGAISGTNPRMRVKGSGATSSTSSFEVQDSAAASLFLIRDDGLINFGTKGTYTESTGRLALTTTGSSGGLLIGGDANLYRSAADVLKTDDSFVVGVNLSVLNAGIFSLYESGSVNFSSFTAGTQANDLRYTLPTTQPTTNQILSASAVSGSGPYDVTLSWVTPAASGITIGDGITGSTVGSVLFVGAGSTLAQDNANFYWDDTNNTLGIGTTRAGAISGTNPSVRIKGTGTSSATSSFEVQDSAAASLFLIRNDGLINLGTKGTYTESTGQVALTANGSGGGLVIGDANLYRSAADVLKTDDSLVVAVNLTVNSLTSTRVPFASTSGLFIDSASFTYTTGTGQLALATTGSGAGVLIGGDTQLYRSAADVLRTPDSLIVDVNLTVSGTASIGAVGGTTGTINLVGSTSGTVSVLVQAAAGTYNFNLPTTAGTSGHVLTSAGGGASAMTWTDPASLAVRWNSIVSPNGNQSLTMSTHTTTWNWATGTSTNNLFNLTTDASANGTGALLRVATGTSSTVVPMLVLAAGTTALTVNASAQVLVGTLTSSRITYAGTNGLLQDSANMTFDGNRIALATTGNTGGLLIGGDANLYRSAADILKTDDAFQALSFNKVTITQPATAATLTIADGATLTVSASATIQNGNHSNTNTGDETATTIHNKAGYTQSFLLMGA